MLNVDFFELPLWAGGLDEAADWMLSLVEAPAPGGTILTHVNLHNRFELLGRPRLLRALRAHGRLFFEGVGMQIGLWLSGGPSVGSVNGTDLFPLVMERACRARVPVYFLGGTEPVAERAAAVARRRWPGLALVGARGGHFARAEEPQVVTRIAESGARLVLIGRGCPLQEEFSARWRSALAPSVLWSVGGLFDFVSGAAPRAPDAMRAARLEWLFRIGREPRRMWQRALVEPPLFLLDLGGGPAGDSARLPGRLADG